MVVWSVLPHYSLGDALPSHDKYKTWGKNNPNLERAACIARKQWYERKQYQIVGLIVSFDLIELNSRLTDTLKRSEGWPEHEGDKGPSQPTQRPVLKWWRDFGHCCLFQTLSLIPIREVQKVREKKNGETLPGTLRGFVGS